MILRRRQSELLQSTPIDGRNPGTLPVRKKVCVNSGEHPAGWSTEQWRVVVYVVETSRGRPYPTVSDTGCSYSQCRWTRSRSTSSD